MSRLSEHLQIEDIVLGVQVANKRHLFDCIGQHMARVHGLPADTVTGALLRRESIGSTGVGQGVAIPHARLEDLDRTRIVYIRLQTAITFGGADERPVSDVVALLVPSPASREHLGLLANTAAMFSQAAFRQTLLACDSALQVKKLFQRWPT